MRVVGRLPKQCEGVKRPRLRTRGNVYMHVISLGISGSGYGKFLVPVKAFYYKGKKGEKKRKKLNFRSHFAQFSPCFPIVFSLMFSPPPMDAARNGRRVGRQVVK